MMLTREESALGSSHTVNAINHPAKTARTIAVANPLPIPSWLTSVNDWRIAGSKITIRPMHQAKRKVPPRLAAEITDHPQDTEDFVQLLLGQKR